MSTLYKVVDAQRLIIKPFDRVWFIVIFVSTMTIYRAIGDSLCWSESSSIPGWGQDRIEYSIRSLHNC
jgi:hypothetical protein